MTGVQTCALPICFPVTIGVQDVVVAAAREMYEETGYKALAERMVQTNTFFPFKSADSVYYVYAYDVSGMNQEKPPGDGSAFEEMGHPRWATEEEILKESKDSVLVGAVYSLKMMGK